MPERNPLNGIITQLKKLPGVGEKSAQRLALFLLSLPKKDVHEFVNEIGYVRDNLSELKDVTDLLIEAKRLGALEEIKQKIELIIKIKKQLKR